MTIYKEIFETLATRSFAALFMSAMFGAVATGLVASLAYLLYTFLWGFTAQQIGLISASVVISAVLALFISPVDFKKTRQKTRRNCGRYSGLYGKSSTHCASAFGLDAGKR